MTQNTPTTGKRKLRDDGWHDDNGPMPVDAEWDPPMTEVEVQEAAFSDPDAQPSAPEQLARMHRVSFARHVRWKLGMSQAEFARRFGIPIGMLRDWEQHRTTPDQAAMSYLKVIARDPGAVVKALDAAE